MNLKIKKINAAAHLPGRATKGAAGLDLKVCCSKDGLTIKPMERILVPTGIAIEIPSAEHVGLVFARSGLSLRQGLAMANGVGVIDSDYRGELLVPMVNLSNLTVKIANGERIAQLVIMPIETPEMLEVETLNETKRGEGGFGSTGNS